MKTYFSRISLLAAIPLLMHISGFAQKEDKDTLDNKLDEYEEIIIKHKSDKDAKVSVEIKNGQVFVNGKPVAEFDDDNVSVRKKKINIYDGQTFSFSGPGDGGAHVFTVPGTRFRKGGGWNMAPGYDDERSDKRAFLGVNFETAEGGAGVKIKSVTKGSAAEKAGLKEGDIITKIDEIKISEADDLPETIHKYKPETKVVITYKREGKEQKATATLGKSTTAAYNKAYGFNYSMPRMEGGDDFNFEIPPIPPMEPYLRKNLAPRAFSWNTNGPRLGIKAQDTEDGKGVKVLDVDEESAAEKAGVKEGDVITRFDGKEVNSATELAEQARASKAKPSVKIALTRNGKSQEVEIKTPRKLKTADL